MSRLDNRDSRIEVNILKNAVKSAITLVVILFCAVFLVDNGALAKDNSATNTQQVKGYTKKNGTVVAGYTRKASTKAEKQPETTQVKGYTKKNGTVVQGYTKKKTSK
jgi:hypothetical protein